MILNTASDLLLAADVPWPRASIPSAELLLAAAVGTCTRKGRSIGRITWNSERSDAPHP